MSSKKFSYQIFVGTSCSSHLNPAYKSNYCHFLRDRICLTIVYKMWAIYISQCA
jgi:hypothetical protein